MVKIAPPRLVLEIPSADGGEGAAPAIRPGAGPAEIVARYFLWASVQSVALPPKELLSNVHVLREAFTSHAVRCPGEGDSGGVEPALASQGGEVGSGRSLPDSLGLTEEEFTALVAHLLDMRFSIHERLGASPYQDQLRKVTIENLSPRPGPVPGARQLATPSQLPSQTPGSALASSLGSGSPAAVERELIKALDTLLVALKRQPLSRHLLDVLAFVVVNSGKPAVRDHTLRLAFDWLDYLVGTLQGLPEDVRARLQLTVALSVENNYPRGGGPLPLGGPFYPLATSPAVAGALVRLVLAGLTDVWSAIRKACAARVGKLAPAMPPAVVEALVGALLARLDAYDASWKVKDGCLLGVASLLGNCGTSLPLASATGAAGGNATAGQQATTHMPVRIKLFPPMPAKNSAHTPLGRGPTSPELSPAARLAWHSMDSRMQATGDGSKSGSSHKSWDAGLGGMGPLNEGGDGASNAGDAPAVTSLTVPRHLLSALYSALEHEQLSVRENAVRALSSLMKKLENTAAVECFFEIIHRLQEPSAGGAAPAPGGGAGPGPSGGNNNSKSGSGSGMVSPMSSNGDVASPGKLASIGSGGSNVRQPWPSSSLEPLSDTDEPEGDAPAGDGGGGGGADGTARGRVSPTGAQLVRALSNGAQAMSVPVGSPSGKDRVSTGMGGASLATGAAGSQAGMFPAWGEHNGARAGTGDKGGASGGSLRDQVSPDGVLAAAAVGGVGGVDSPQLRSPRKRFAAQRKALGSSIKEFSNVLKRVVIPNSMLSPSPAVAGSGSGNGTGTPRRSFDSLTPGATGTPHSSLPSSSSEFGCSSAGSLRGSTWGGFGGLGSGRSGGAGDPPALSPLSLMSARLRSHSMLSHSAKAGKYGRHMDGAGGQSDTSELVAELRQLSAMSAASARLLEAAAAEGLLSALGELAGCLPCDFLADNWSAYIPTVERYLAHPASTVRQTTSSVILSLVTASQGHDKGAAGGEKAPGSASKAGLGHKPDPQLMVFLLRRLAEVWPYEVSLSGKAGEADRKPGVAGASAKRHRSGSPATPSTPSSHSRSSSRPHGHSHHSKAADASGRAHPLQALTVGGDLSSSDTEGPRDASGGSNGPSTPTAKTARGASKAIPQGLGWQVRRASWPLPVEGGEVASVLLHHAASRLRGDMSQSWEWKEGRLLVLDLVLHTLLSSIQQKLLHLSSLPQTAAGGGAHARGHGAPSSSSVAAAAAVANGNARPDSSSLIRTTSSNGAEPSAGCGPDASGKEHQVERPSDRGGPGGVASSRDGVGSRDASMKYENVEGNSLRGSGDAAPSSLYSIIFDGAVWSSGGSPGDRPQKLQPPSRLAAASKGRVSALSSQSVRSMPAHGTNRRDNPGTPLSPVRSNDSGGEDDFLSPDSESDSPVGSEGGGSCGSASPSPRRMFSSATVSPTSSPSALLSPASVRTTSSVSSSPTGAALSPSRMALMVSASVSYAAAAASAGAAPTGTSPPGLSTSPGLAVRGGEDLVVPNTVAGGGSTSRLACQLSCPVAPSSGMESSGELQRSPWIRSMSLPVYQRVPEGELGAHNSSPCSGKTGLAASAGDPGQWRVSPPCGPAAVVGPGDVLALPAQLRPILTGRPTGAAKSPVTGAVIRAAGPGGVVGDGSDAAGAPPSSSSQLPAPSHSPTKGMVGMPLPLKGPFLRLLPDMVSNLGDNQPGSAPAPSGRKARAHHVASADGSGARGPSTLGGGSSGVPALNSPTRRRVVSFGGKSAGHGGSPKIPAGIASVGGLGGAKDGLSSLGDIMERMLQQVVQCLGSLRWEVRRMARQVVPQLTELLLLLDPQVLVWFWRESLLLSRKQGESLRMCVTCLSLKHSMLLIRSYQDRCAPPALASATAPLTRGSFSLHTGAAETLAAATGASISGMAASQAPKPVEPRCRCTELAMATIMPWVGKLADELASLSQNRNRLGWNGRMLGLETLLMASSFFPESLTTQQHHDNLRLLVEILQDWGVVLRDGGSESSNHGGTAAARALRGHVQDLPAGGGCDPAGGRGGHLSDTGGRALTRTRSGRYAAAVRASLASGHTAIMASLFGREAGSGGAASVGGAHDKGPGSPFGGPHPVVTRVSTAPLSSQSSGAAGAAAPGTGGSAADPSGHLARVAHRKLLFLQRQFLRAIHYMLPTFVRVCLALATGRSASISELALASALLSAGGGGLARPRAANESSSPGIVSALRRQRSTAPEDFYGQLTRSWRASEEGLIPCSGITGDAGGREDEEPLDPLAPEMMSALQSLAPLLVPLARVADNARVIADVFGSLHSVLRTLLGQAVGEAGPGGSLSRTGSCDAASLGVLGGWGVGATGSAGKSSSAGKGKGSTVVARPLSPPSSSSLSRSSSRLGHGDVSVSPVSARCCARDACVLAVVEQIVALLEPGAGLAGPDGSASPTGAGASAAFMGSGPTASLGGLPGGMDAFGGGGGGGGGAGACASITKEVSVFRMVLDIVRTGARILGDRGTREYLLPLALPTLLGLVLSRHPPVGGSHGAKRGALAQGRLRGGSAGWHDDVDDCDVDSDLDRLVEGAIREGCVNIVAGNTTAGATGDDDGGAGNGGDAGEAEGDEGGGDVSPDGSASSSSSAGGNWDDWDESSEEEPEHDFLLVEVVRFVHSMMALGAIARPPVVRSPVGGRRGKGRRGDVHKKPPVPLDDVAYLQARHAKLYVSIVAGLAKAEVCPQ
eukprot:jgi/Mesvir1/20923/Mv07994-RA.1